MTELTKSSSKQLKKFLTLQEVVDVEKGPLWVLNTSASLDTGNSFSGGDVFVTVMLGNQARVAQVPFTWLPTLLTDQFPRKEIINSPNFMEAVTKGLVKLITPEYAEILSSKDGAADERQRLQEQQNAVRLATQAGGIGKNTTVVFSDSDDTPKPKNSSQISLSDDSDDAEDSPAEVTPRFKAFINSLNSETEKSAKARMRNVTEVTEEEAQYLIANCTHASIVASVRQKLEASA